MRRSGISLQALATHIVRDGARLHNDERTRAILGPELYVYRVPLRGGHMDVVVNEEQRAAVWRLIEQQ